MLFPQREHVLGALQRAAAGVKDLDRPRFQFVRSALFKGTYEDNERRLVRGLLKPGDRVLEIGTGIGLVSLVCAKICGAGNVLSYEANPQLERIIRKNYELNGLTPNLRMRAVTTDGRSVSFFRPTISSRHPSPNERALPKKCPWKATVSTT